MTEARIRELWDSEYFQMLDGLPVRLRGDAHAIAFGRQLWNEVCEECVRISAFERLKYRERGADYAACRGVLHYVEDQIRLLKLPEGK